MPTSTSRAAYRAIKTRGTASTQASLILAAIGSAVLSLREIVRLTGIEINAVSGRVNELKKAGELHPQPKRHCSITGMTVTPVGRLPVGA